MGGTWWVNTYPGCQCDIPSHLYSFSFAPNPRWSRTYPKQPEIRHYLKECSQRFGIRDRIRFGCAVGAAEWNEEGGHWRVDTDKGPYEVDILISAPGPLSEPSIPTLAGREQFHGTTFHTARWQHDHDLSGRRVAVVGTGATAIQVVPEIQPLVDQLFVIQRTPPWVVPHSDRKITGAERWLYERIPLAQRLNRAGIFWLRELLLVPGLTSKPRLLKGLEWVARRHIRKQVPDPEFRARLTPKYRIGCKRILPSNRWYPAITQPNVEVVEGGVARLVQDGLVTADGSVKEVDTVIFATGFYVTDIPSARMIKGRGGTTLAEVWDGSPQAYAGTAVPGFPNLFLMVGPNTGLGHNSIVFMIESQIDHVLRAIEKLGSRDGTRIEARPDVFESYNRNIQQRIGRSVWNSGGCSSWYIDRNGKNTTIWPSYCLSFRRLVRQASDDYEITQATAPPPT